MAAYDLKSLRKFAQDLKLNSWGMYEPSETRVMRAMRDLPVVLADMETDPELAVCSAGMSESLVFAEILIRSLGTRGHRRPSGAWAIYRLIERGKLCAEIRDVQPPNKPAVWVTIRLPDGTIAADTDPSWVRATFFDREMGRERCLCLVVWARPELWEWHEAQVMSYPPATEAGEWKAKPPEITWPPVDGWGFRPGEFSYSGKVHSLSGRPWELLQLFVDAKGRALSIKELSKSLDKDLGPIEVTIRGYISDLRKLLREKLNLPPTHDPVKRIGKGTYRLDVPQVS